MLNAHKKLRQRFHPLNSFTPPHVFNHIQIPLSVANHIYTDKGHKMSLETLLTCANANRWDTALSNELGRLTQGNNTGITSQDAMDFIHYHEVPSTAKVTYASFVCDYRPLKDEPWRVRLVVGGDKLTYQFDTCSPATSLLETKLLLNSIISDAHKGARFMSLDIKDFFLTTPMGTNEYMRIPTKCIPHDIFSKYNLTTKIHNGYIYCKIKKGMHGLKQAAVLAFNRLKENLAPYGLSLIHI